MTSVGEVVVPGPVVRVSGTAQVRGINAGAGVIVSPAPGPGAGAGATHQQDEPADVWIVDHNLGRRPVAWTLYDSDDHLRDEYLVEHPTVNRAVVRMDVPTAGTIRMI